MFNVGISELLCFVVIAVLVLGPDKLPQAARFAGKTYSKFKRMMSSVQNEIDRELRLSELQNQMQQELERIQQLEQRLNEQMRSQQHGLEQSLSNHASGQSARIDSLSNMAKPIHIQQPLQWIPPQQHRLLMVLHPQFTQKQSFFHLLAKSA